MKPVTRARLLCSSVGAILGFAAGFLFLLFSPSSRPFFLFLPITFAAVFAAVSFAAAEEMFPALRDVILGFLALGGALFIWHHFMR
jgi:uncharacterized membrane protein